MGGLGLGRWDGTGKSGCTELNLLSIIRSCCSLLLFRLDVLVSVSNFERLPSKQLLLLHRPSNVTKTYPWLAQHVSL